MNSDYDYTDYDHYSYDDRNNYDDFADPGGKSALRRATKDNPRNLPCRSCERPNMLTAKDVALGYQCDYCADAAESNW